MKNYLLIKKIEQADVVVIYHTCGIIKPRYNIDLNNYD